MKEERTKRKKKKRKKKKKHFEAFIYPINFDSNQ